MNAQTVRLYTHDEYLELEARGAEKHEYLRGEVWAMAGASYRHTLLASRILQSLGQALAGRPCVVLGSDLRVRVDLTDLFTYPDLSVICGKHIPSATDQHSVTNPTVLVEILSESTERYDRGAKFAHYQRLESLQEYVLVSQDRKRIEVYRRGEGDSWIYRLFGDGAQVPLASLGITLDLESVYFDPTA